VDPDLGGPKHVDPVDPEHWLKCRYSNYWYLVGFGGEGEARLEGRDRVQEAQHVLSSAET
jgi:hypothetical protein